MSSSSARSSPAIWTATAKKAGLTGWAQVNGLRGDTSIGERTKYDLWYIENWSIGLDLKIIIRTILQTLFGTNQNAILNKRSRVTIYCL
ncbi:MAG: sugar transferase [Caldilineaceae bacterium]